MEAERKDRGGDGGGRKWWQLGWWMWSWRWWRERNGNGEGWETVDGERARGWSGQMGLEAELVKL
jgi:hypothetical protein